MQRKIGITETLFRDAHQSLLATRLKIEHMLAVAEMIDEVGYHSVEVWGGATFDTCLRYLNEDPWERLRTLRKRMPRTKLQMLLRGQNLVAYRQYPDDVVDTFVAKAVENGIDIIRIFDALNDTRNIERALRAVKKTGAHAQASVVYTVSPAHDIPGYVKIAKELVEMGADSICIKDMAGLLTPARASELVRQLKQAVNVPIQLHSHYTCGFASMAYWEGIQPAWWWTQRYPRWLGNVPTSNGDDGEGAPGNRLRHRPGFEPFGQDQSGNQESPCRLQEAASSGEHRVMVSQIPGGCPISGPAVSRSSATNTTRFWRKFPVRKELGYLPW